MTHCAFRIWKKEIAWSLTFRTNARSVLESPGAYSNRALTGFGLHLGGEGEGFGRACARASGGVGVDAAVHPAATIKTTSRGKPRRRMRAAGIRP